MNHRVVLKLALLTGMFFLVTSMAFMVPNVLGQASATQSMATPSTVTTESTLPVFEVATIKPTNPDARGSGLQFTLDGFTARNVSLLKVIQAAYGVHEEERIYGGPAWLNSKKIDIEAKMDVAEMTGYKDLSLDQRKAMLRALLVERFKLTLHHEAKEFSVYALLIAKNGPKLQQSSSKSIRHSEIKGYDAVMTRRGRGHFEVQRFAMADLAFLLHDSVGRVVVDKTGLTERYDFSLYWTPEDLTASATNPAPSNQQVASLPDSSWPSIFIALQEQLGLRLESTKCPVDTIVIDHAELPSEN